MKVSKLIKRLQKVQDEHGDVEVTIYYDDPGNAYRLEKVDSVRDARLWKKDMKYDPSIPFSEHYETVRALVLEDLE